MTPFYYGIKTAEDFKILEDINTFTKALQENAIALKTALVADNHVMQRTEASIEDVIEAVKKENKLLLQIAKDCSSDEGFLCSILMFVFTVTLLMIFFMRNVSAIQTY